MDIKFEELLIEKAKQNISSKTTSLKGEVHKVDVSRYTDQKLFKKEVKQIFNKRPTVLLHSSEVENLNSYQTVETTMGSLIVSRDSDGQVHVFRNSCRHRGAKVVEGKGCSKRIVCPYHAWSYSTDGKLSNVPGQQHCFPNIEKSENGLIEIPCIEKFGFIWVCPNKELNSSLDTHIDEHLGDMREQLNWIEANNLKLFKRTCQVRKANWKLLAEGGLETYHFSFAHKNTIAPFFHNNIAVIDQISSHFRVFMPTKILDGAMKPEHQPLSIHDCSHMLYYLTPNMGLLVQREHVDLIQFRPLTVDETEISVSSLIPKNADLDSPQQLSHWQKNLDITNQTLDEDWVLGESIHDSMISEALPYIQYGKNEWALHEFNAVLQTMLGESDSERENK